MGATWSLAVEEQFYLLFPLVVYFVPAKKLPYFLFACIILAIPLRAALYHWFSAEHFLSFYVLMPCRADALSIGVLCAIIFRSDHFTELVVNNINWIRCIVVITLAALIFLTDPIISSRPMIFFFGYTALSTIYGAVLLMCILGPVGHIRRFMAMSWLRSLGKIAFAVYLFHLPVAGFVFWIVSGEEPSLNSLGDLVVCLGAICLTIILGSISWILFERHLIGFGSRLNYTEESDISFRYQAPDF